MSLTRIGIHTLIDFELKSGSIDQRRSSSEHTALEGTWIHQKLQKQAGADYQKEVPLKMTWQLEDGQKFIIDGRADGIIYDKEHHTYLIDEIKTSETEFDQLEESTLTLYWGQVKFYGYMLAKTQNLSTVDLQLTYYQTLTKAITRTQQHLTIQELTVFVQPILKDYAGWLIFEAKWKRNRQQAAQRLKFPFKNFRPKQRTLATSVYKTILSKQRLLAEAPTGTGKTMATLFPAVKALGENKLNRIFYFTAKQSTRQVAEKALTRLADNGAKLKSVTLTAKDKICFLEERICTPEHCPFAKGYFDRRKAGIKDVLAHENQITRPVIEDYAHKHQLCPFELSLDLSLFSDVLICDYNYLFDPLVYLQRFFTDKAEDSLFLIDEAHNLVKRSRDMYSATISDAALPSLLTTIDKAVHKNRLTKRLQRQLTKIADIFTVASQQVQKETTDQLVLETAPLQLMDQLNAFIELAHDWLKNQEDTPLTQQVLNYYLVVIRFTRIYEFYGDNYRTEIQTTKQCTNIKLLCLDPQSYLDASLAKGKAAVLFSATLSPMSYYRQILGSPEALGYRLPSPFPEQNQRILIPTYIKMTYRERAQNIPKVTESLLTLTQAKTGNYLIFCPSYHLLEQIYTAFHLAAPQISVQVQATNMTETQRHDFLAAFQVHPKKTLVGFAVLGGIFSEGIDLTGDRLIGIAIISVGLPRLSQENEALKTYFNMKNQQGFSYAYQLPGMNNVLQAAGRLIRQMADRGVVLLLDQRFLRSDYQQYFPAHWRKQIAIAHSSTELQHEITQFWRNHQEVISENH